MDGWRISPAALRWKLVAELADPGSAGRPDHAALSWDDTFVSHGNIVVVDAFDVFE
jgi:hypothetical protein